MTKRVLISVSDKTGIVEFAKGLDSLGYEIISTGGTAKAISEAGIPVITVDQVTGFPEILGGRVKTLHPKVHGGILAMRDNQEHKEQMTLQGIEYIDLVVVNLYPFAQTISKEGVTLEDAIENIDIGGPTMVRSAAKNHKYVGVVTNPDRYEEIVAELKQGSELSYQTRFNLAVEAFKHTAEYDAVISDYLYKQVEDAPLFPNHLTLPLEKVSELRYGENPQQKAAFYKELPAKEYQISTARQIQGKALSFNNYNDLNAAWEMVQEFEEPTVVAVKHTNPCGVGSEKNVAAAYKKAFDADPVSIFGGIIAVNIEVNGQVAKEMNKIFLEAVIAPSYSKEALQEFSKKKDLRILELGIPKGKATAFDYKKVSGGLLVQELDNQPIKTDEWEVVTDRKPNEQELADLQFALKVVKHVKSNAILLAKGGQTIGVGAGQMNRVGATEIAVKQAGEKAKGSALASDAFFPFKDTVEVAAKAGVTAIVQPGGSMKDKESIEECNKHKITMVFAGRRFFKH